jgi:hypothetical protein
MKTPAKTGRRSRKSSEAPSSEPGRNPFWAGRKFQAVNAQASAKVIAAGRPVIA